MAKTEISVKINTARDARLIVSNFNSNNDVYLRDIIALYVPYKTRHSTNSMDHRDLLRYGKVIHNVAKKIVTDMEKAKLVKPKQEIPNKESKIEQLSLFS